MGGHHVQRTIDVAILTLFTYSQMLFRCVHWHPLPKRPFYRLVRSQPLLRLKGLCFVKIRARWLSTTATERRRDKSQGEERHLSKQLANERTVFL